LLRKFVTYRKFIKKYLYSFQYITFKGGNVMMRKKFGKCVLLLALAAMIFAMSGASSEAGDAAFVADAAKRVYVYGYPLVIMSVTERVMATSDDVLAVNAFHHAGRFPDASFTDVVSPNADTLYSQAWLELGGGPVVLSVPDIEEGRYYLMQCMDAWSNVFASIGSRTTGNGAGKFLFTGPKWSGVVPSGMTQVASPTDRVWILGRTETRGASDYDAVHAIQASYWLSPLDGRAFPPADPAVDAKTAPVVQMDDMEAEDFFTALCADMAANPAPASDNDILDTMAEIGLTPGVFDRSAIPADTWEAMKKGYADGHASVIEMSTGPLGHVNGVWNVMPDDIGNFGTDYDLRAAIGRVALGANIREDAIYPATRKDTQGISLSGSRQYIIHFEKGRLPPVKAFWSITMYNDRQFFVDNPINRYAIGDRDAMQYDKDGGLSIYVRRDSPGKELESNWLPAPEGDFNLIMRLYWPEVSILDGSWPMPALVTEDGHSDSGNGGSGGGCNAGVGTVSLAIFVLAVAAGKKRR
jgi:hypothetical protein